ncbi:MAG: hypothetical protein GXO48_00385 [Chlorobi bacterium]|nr:hypothetical protein [Chlorobiota bacterium]
MKKVEVLLPVASLKSIYTYSWADSLPEPEVGMPVVVPLGNKQVAGIVVEVHNRDVPYELKPVKKIISESPIVKQWQIDQWQFLAKRYCVPEGLVLDQAIPPLLRGKVQKQWHLVKKPEPRLLQALSYEAYPILKTITDSLIMPMTERQLLKFVPISKQTLRKYLNLLKDAEIVTDEYQILRAGKTLKIAYKAIEVENYEPLLKRSPSQKEAYLWFLNQGKPIPREEVPFKSQIIKKLIDKGLVETISWTSAGTTQSNIQPAQYSNEDFIIGGQFVQRINVLWEEINSHINEGKQVLILVPTIEHLQVFIDEIPFNPDTTAFYAYSLTPPQRKKVWEEVFYGRKKLVVGTRSALFLPWENLSLIVFEEPASQFHENIAKTPHLHSNTVATWLSEHFNSRIIYSGTTLNSPLWYSLQTNKKRSLNINSNQSELWLSDLRYAPEVRKQENPFSSQVWTLINESIKGKILVLVARKGFTSLSCSQCQWTAQCPVCKTPLRLIHNKLKCEFCGYSEPYTDKCPLCGGETVRNASLGPEKVTEELRKRFPDVPIYTISPDITPQPHQRKALIEWFNAQDNAIIVGTYPVLNALLYKPVDLAIVQNLYTILKISGYNVKDNAMHMLSFIKQNARKMVVQTYDVEDPVLEALMKNKFDIYFNHELDLRKIIQIPPFGNLFIIELAHVDNKKLQIFKEELISCLKMQGLTPQSDISSIRRNKMRWATIVVKTDKFPEDLPLLSQCLNSIYKKLGKFGELHFWFNPVSK